MYGSWDAKTVMVITLFRTRQLASLVGMILLFGSIPLTQAVAQPTKGRNAFQLVQDRHRERFQEYSNDVKKLAAECEKNGLVAELDEIRSRIFVPDTHSFRLSVLPTEVRPELPQNVTGDDQRTWQKRLRHLESDYAKDLYTISKFALRQGFPSYAYNLIREAALHDPDNPQIRKVLGFVRLKNEWVTPFAFVQMKEGKVWHEDFGWLPKTYVPKYLNGERFFKQHWVSADKEKLLRVDFNLGWEVRTDHYLIKTNVSLEKGVEMGKALEDFYSVFNETFAGFFNTPEQLQKLFDGSNNAIRAAATPYRIHFYKNREEYLENMRKFFPSIDQTNGVYLTSERVAYFYYDPNQNHEGTLFHEATHQLFFESFKSNRSICENHHFWIIEGIACYMESFQRKNGDFSLGDAKHIRFVGARHNLLQKNYYVPLQKFSDFGMQEFQSDPELVKNYTQAAGLARFFMHFDNGRYREALVKHLVQLYSGNDRIREQADGLDVLTGVDFAELDLQYKDDARETEKQLAKDKEEKE